MEWDIFISHASEDTETVAIPLSDLLKGNGLKVWLDSNELRLGDSLFNKINAGLSHSKFGVVILSEAFAKKEYTNNELASLHALEIGKQNSILPVWHGVDQQTVIKLFPLTAHKLAINTQSGIVNVALEILKVVIPTKAHEIGFPMGNFYLEDKSYFSNIQPLFDRPAFKGPFLWQTDPHPAAEAYEIILKALGPDNPEI